VSWRRRRAQWRETSHRARRKDNEKGSARAERARRSGCTAREVASSIAASARRCWLRSATSAALRVLQGENRLLIPVGKNLRQRLAAKTLRPGGIARALPALRILQAGMAAFDDQPAQPARLAGKNIAIRPPSE
jgi:hypothetical protein